MQWQIRLSSLAKQDIKHALNQTWEKFGKAKHDEYRDLIRIALIDIASNPQNPPAKPRPEINPDALVFHIGRRGKRAKHMFIYRVHQDGNIDVARLLYDGMDIEKHLPDEYQA